MKPAWTPGRSRGEGPGSDIPGPEPGPRERLGPPASSVRRWERAVLAAPRCSCNAVLSKQILRLNGYQVREAEDDAGHASLVRVQGESAEMNGRKLAKAATVLTLPFGGRLCVFTLWGGNTQPDKAARAALGIGDLGLATKPCVSGGVPLRDARTPLLPPACRQRRGLHWILAPAFCSSEHGCLLLLLAFACVRPPF